MNKFETDFIKETKEKESFSGIPARNFFKEWCNIHDKGLNPEFISRKEWEAKQSAGEIAAGEYKKDQKLFLPEDLKLWEMVDVIGALDYDTQERRPYLRQERVDKILDLGEIFVKAGAYLNHYLPEIKQGQDIAKEMADEFYSHGLSLQNKKENKDEIPEDIEVSEEDMQELDKWFLGTKVYENQKVRLGDNATVEEIEKRRTELLNIYFAALTREGFKGKREKSWETKKGPVQNFHEKTQKGIMRAVEAPEREMQTAVFRRGKENLVTEIESSLELDKQKLYEALQIPKLKEELDTIRETGDISAIAKKEREIAENIQRAVCAFKYKWNVYNPSEIIKNKRINCVGSSLLGGALLEEVGIKYLHSDLPEHSATVLITSEDKVYWQDFTPSHGYTHNHEITNERIIVGGQIADILKFRTNPDAHGIKLVLKSPKNENVQMSLFDPELGIQGDILNNTGNALDGLGKTEEAIEAYRQAIETAPQYAYPYNGLGNRLGKLGRTEEAIEAYRQAIEIDPQYASPYFGLGMKLSQLGRDEEAIEALEEFKKLWEGDDEFIAIATDGIEELKERKKNNEFARKIRS